jgi:DNA invertase Pin-like site-specific DNA recombinase|tara:strand:- start:26 stop:169 length:144 start_codon:yes stop_codon:yes gene_type:complete
MKYHSRRKVNKVKRVFINFMYKMGVPVKDIKNMVGVSRATVYRHLNK